MPPFRERNTRQQSLLHYACELGWHYLPPDEALCQRWGERGLVLHQVLVRQLQRLNPGMVDSLHAEEIARQLCHLPPTLEGNLVAWEFLQGLRAMEGGPAGWPRPLRLLDALRVDANTFHVTDDLAFRSGHGHIHVDAIFFVNGFPVLLAETHAAAHLEGLAEGLDHVHRCHREAPELMGLIQLYALWQRGRLYYGATWGGSGQVFLNPVAAEGGAGEDSPLGLLAPRRLLRLLTHGVLFTRRDGDLSKVVLRPHQMGAVERFLACVRDPGQRGALAWHAPGSGRTTALLATARGLCIDPACREAMVLLLTAADGPLPAGLNPTVVARSCRRLQQLLRDGWRGLALSTVDLWADLPAAISAPEDVIVLADEPLPASTSLHALPHARHIGFAGAREAPDCLDRYSPREAIADGAAVPLCLCPAPRWLQLDRAILDREFFNPEDLAGVSRPAELDRKLAGTATLLPRLKDHERLARLAAFVAGHYRERVEPLGYKALLVAADREACALLKEELDKRLPPECSAVILRAGRVDSPAVRRYHRRAQEEERIRQAFGRPQEMPRLLIVTDELLTTLDAPPLYALYLDKPLGGRLLLQTLIRAAHPYEDMAGRRKPAGLIVDCLGLLREPKRALGPAAADAQGMLEGLAAWRRRFAEQVLRGRREALSIIRGLEGERAVAAVLEHWAPARRRETFYRYFAGLQALYEVLAPDEALHPYLEDYRALARLACTLRMHYEWRVAVERSLLPRTAALLHGAAALREQEAAYRLDAEALTRPGGDAPAAVRVAALARALGALIASRRAGSPYLFLLRDRAETIMGAYQEGGFDAPEALRRLEAVIEEYRRAEEGRRAFAFSPAAFAVFWFLQRRGAPGAANAARQMERALAANSGWRDSGEAMRAVRAALCDALAGAGIEEAAAAANRLLATLAREA